MTLTITPRDLADLDVLAAGAVLWRAGVGGVEVALVHRPRYDDWSFPKGKLAKGEVMPFAAVREVSEETGHGCRLGALLGDVQYPVVEGAKLVRYWAAEASTGEFASNHETDHLRWLAPPEAAELLTYPHDRSVLGRFTELAPPRSVLLLVRHAKAGSRQQWDGADAQRPLSGTGRQQAEQLAALLPLFGPDRLVSAPLVRCRQTVEPLADRLGLPVDDEPLLGEDDYWAEPGAGLGRLRELAERPGVTAVSSQGGVIPDLVRTLVTEHPAVGVDPDEVASRKSSTWVLTFTGNDLRSADYYPDPTGA